MATGDIISVTIRPDGWSADVVQEGDCTGGTYDFGLGTNNGSLATSKFILTVTSEGYNASGVLGTIVRNVYGTAIVRNPYPDHATLDQTYDGSTNTTSRIALSDFVYDDDKNGGAGTSGVDVAVAISGGWCTVVGTPQSAFSGTATNNSTLDYPQAFGRWAYPPFEHVTGDFLAEASCWHRSGIACVKFDAVDEHAHSAAQQTASAMTKTTRTGDANTVLVHAATIPVTGMTSGDVVTCNFTAYPNVGDADSAFSSDLVANGGDGIAAPDERPGPLPVYYWTGDVVYAVVDPAEANETNGRASTALATAEAGKFKTIGGAINTATYGIKAVNGGTADAAIIYLVAGNHAFPGAALAGGNTKAWCRILPHPTLGAKATSIINAGSNTNVSGYLKVEGLTVSHANTGGFVGNATTSCLWLHNNVLDMSGTAPVYTWKCCYSTQNSVTAFKAGFKAYSTYNSPWALFRGNTTTLTAAADATAEAYCFLGNSQWQAREVVTGNAAGEEITDRAIIAFNSHVNLNIVFMSDWGKTTAISALAVVGNVVERITSGVEPCIQIAADSSAANANHVIFWHNTVMGARCNLAYNDSGSTAYDRLNWSQKYNALRDWNNKDDTFAPENAARVGSWPVGYGVGSYGNRHEISTFAPEYGGLDYAVVGDDGIAYVDNASLTGDDSGSGDYHPATGSVLLNRIPAGMAVIPYDLEGNAIPNDGTGDAGALQDQLTSAPTVTTTAASAVTQTSAVVAGEATANGSPVTDRGVCWAVAGGSLPTYLDANIDLEAVEGVLSPTISGLLPATDYVARHWADSPEGLTYGNTIEFTTLEEDDDSVSPKRMSSASGSDLDGASASSFVFAGMVTQAVIQSLPSYTGLLFVKLNSDTAASASNWDMILEPGKSLVIKNTGVKSASIFGTVAATYGTHFNVRGYKA